jgi:hypothetical protein
MSEAQSITQRKFQNCQKFEPDTARAIQWVRANRDKFRGQVFEPPRMSISVKDPRNVKMAEAVLTKANLKVCFLL